MTAAGATAAVDRTPVPDAEVCIIGAGPAGALVAHRLAEAGIDVVVLEAGPRFDRERDRERMEKALRPAHPPVDTWEMGGQRDRYTTSGSVSYPLNTRRVKGVGGSTLAWGARLNRFHEKDFEMDVNFRNSAAWQLRYGCIYINGDRFEQPTVDDPNALREELRERLTALTDRDGNRVFQTVLFPEDAYNDPDPDLNLPDVIARPAPGYLPLRAWSPTDECVIPKPGNDHYDHRYWGLFAADGPAFDTDASVEDMSIVDVVPTLLHALGAPLAPDFDGDARTDILATSAEPRVLDAADVPTPQVAEASAGGELDEEVVERRLEDLGYLE